MMAANFGSLQERALHELVKVCWGDFVLILPFDDSDRDNFDFLKEEKKKIVAHRKSVTKRISKTFAYTLPKILKDQLVDAVIRLQRGYHEALVCTEMHRDLSTPVNPLTSGPYSAKNFINLHGHFNELAWAKSFVSDANRSALRRFEIACNYCFEEVIKDLWYSTIRKENHPYEGGFRNIRKKSDYFVAVWVCWLENKFDQEVQEETEFAHGFYVSGFRKAMDQTNEYASRFFWAGCSDTEKISLMNEIIAYVEGDDIDDIDNLSLIAFHSYAGFVNFIYSLLSIEQKRLLILRDIDDHYFIWSCLLLSPFYQSVLNDIKTIPFPSKLTFFILDVLTSTMLQLPIPEYKEIFKILWKSLSQKQREEILEIDNRLIPELTELNDSMDLLDTVIRSFSRSVKERMLLYDWQYAGMSALDEFSNEGDYDAILRYLLLFLVDRDPVTQRLSVRDDATDLLDRLTSGDIFLLWTKGQIPEYEKQEVRNVVDSLQGSLHVLHTLLDRVEEIQSDGTKSTCFSVTEKENYFGGTVVRKLKRSLVDQSEGTNKKKQKLSSEAVFI